MTVDMFRLRNPKIQYAETLTIYLPEFVTCCFNSIRTCTVNILTSTTTIIYYLFNIIANDYQQDATILAYLFIPNQLYIFRAMSSPIITST